MYSGREYSASGRRPAAGSSSGGREQLHGDSARKASGETGSRPTGREEDASAGADHDSIDERHRALLYEYLSDRSNVVKHQIESFDHFLHFDLNEILSSEADLIAKYPSGQICVLRFYEPVVGRPSSSDADGERPVLPSEVRQRDDTYEAPLYCNIRETRIARTEGSEADVIKVKDHHRVLLAMVPVMVRSSACNLARRMPGSGECPNDPGGYFVVKGRERVLVAQVRGMYNTITVQRKKTGSAGGPGFIALTRSMSDITSHSVVVRCRFMGSRESIGVGLVYVRDVVPIGILFKALGFEQESDWAPFLAGIPQAHRRYVDAVIEASACVRTRTEAQAYIGSLSVHPIAPEARVRYAQQILESEMMPHLGPSCSNAERAAFLGRMAVKLVLCHTGLRVEDDRDNYRSKRVESAGPLFRTLFWTVFKRFLKMVRVTLCKKADADVPTVVSGIRVLTQNLRHCFLTGSWGAQKNSYMRVGVAQVMSRMNYIATISHLRRVSIPVGRQGKNSKMRLVNSSHAFFICPVETPEVTLARFCFFLSSSQ